MFFLTDLTTRTIFGWSAKSGCTHVKALFYYLTEGELQNPAEKYLHSDRECGYLPENIESYHLILFVRNPFQRLVSGFTEKYSSQGQFHYQWPSSIPRTFRNFVAELERPNWEIIDRHHFTPQFSEAWTGDAFRARITTFPIERINYPLLSTIFKKRIPVRVLDYRGGHQNEATHKDFGPKSLTDIPLSEYENFRPPRSNFFDASLREKVVRFYQNDFLLLQRLGLDYRQ